MWGQKYKERNGGGWTLSCQRGALRVIDCFQIQSTEVKPHWGIDLDLVVTSRRDHVDVCVLRRNEGVRVNQWMNKTIRGRHTHAQQDTDSHTHTVSLPTSQHTSKRESVDWVHMSGPLPQRDGTFQIALHTAPVRPTHRPQQLWAWICNSYTLTVTFSSRLTWPPLLRIMLLVCGG